MKPAKYANLCAVGHQRSSLHPRIRALANGQNFCNVALAKSGLKSCGFNAKSDFPFCRNIRSLRHVKHCQYFRHEILKTSPSLPACDHSVCNKAQLFLAQMEGFRKTRNIGYRQYFSVRCPEHTKFNYFTCSSLQNQPLTFALDHSELISQPAISSWEQT